MICDCIQTKEGARSSNLSSNQVYAAQSVGKRMKRCLKRKRKREGGRRMMSRLFYTKLDIFWRIALSFSLS